MASDRRAPTVGGNRMDTFGAELERWMQARAIGVRELSRRSGYSAGYLTQLRQGRRNPSPEAARDLDDTLNASGALASLAPSRERRRQGYSPPRPCRAQAGPRLAGSPSVLLAGTSGR